MIGELRVITDLDGLFAFVDLEDSLRTWSGSVYLEPGECIFIVAKRKTEFTVRLKTLWDFLFLCRHGLCYTHDDFIEWSTAPG